MKRNLFIFLSLILFGISFSAKAHDFTAINSNGDTIYYKITSSIAPYSVAVTYKDYFGDTICEYRNSITIPSSVTNNGITYSVTSISTYAFSNCWAMTSISLPNTIDSICGRAFAFCYGLTSITIPNSVTLIGDYVFNNCTNLASITIGNSVSKIDYGAFSPCISLTSIIIPPSITSIGDYAFYDCSSLSSVSIPNSISKIGVAVFEECSSLSSISIPNSVDTIEIYAFHKCINLTTITIGNSLRSIGSDSFRDCYNLSSINFPNTLKSIGERAFQDCRSLTSINIPDSINKIENKTFYRCYGINSLITNNVHKIEREAFSCCSNLTTINFGNKLDTIGEFAFDSCVNLTYFSLPNSLRLLGGVAFRNCNGFTSITIPDSLVDMRDAFYNCANLRTVNYNAINQEYGGSNYSSFYGSPINQVNIGNHVMSIRSYLFKSLPELHSITIPSSVNTIWHCAFEDCINLDTIIIQRDTPPVFVNYAFRNVPTNIPVIVPCGSLSLYQSANNWNSFTNYQQAGFSVNIIDTIHMGETYTYYGFNSDSTGTYSQTFQTSGGCDSTLVLTLTVLGLSAPNNLQIQNNSNNIELTWEGYGDSFEIMRNNIVIERVVGVETYNDYNVVAGTNYCYKVRALTENYESELSEEVCQLFSGLNDISNKEIKTTLYPNPTTDKAKLEVEGLNRKADVVVYDLQGRIIKTYKLNTNQTELEIDVTGFSKGIYNIKVINDSNTITKKLIVG